MKRVLARAVKEGVIIVIVAVAVSLVVNYTRKDGVPLVAEAEAFRVRTDAEFVKVEDANRFFEDGVAIFIDARAPELFGLRHIEGAINVSPVGGAAEEAAWLASVDSYIVCYASETSQRQAGVVADQLLQMGCDKVLVLYGGIEAWIEMGLPTEQAAD